MLYLWDRIATRLAICQAHDDAAVSNNSQVISPFPQTVCRPTPTHLPARK